MDAEASQENFKRPEKAPKRHPKRHPKVVQNLVKKLPKSAPKNEQKKTANCLQKIALTGGSLAGFGGHGAFQKTLTEDALKKTYRQKMASPKTVPN